MPRGKPKSEELPPEQSLPKEKHKLSADIPPLEYRQLLKLKNCVEQRVLDRENWDVHIGIGVIVRAALVNLYEKQPDEILQIIENLEGQHSSE